MLASCHDNYLKLLLRFTEIEVSIQNYTELYLKIAPEMYIIFL